MKSTFGQRLKALRKIYNRKQMDVAEAINIDKRQMRRYEKDEQLPTIDKIMKLSVYYNISPNYFLFDEIDLDAFCNDVKYRDYFYKQKEKTEEMIFIFNDLNYYKENRK